MILLIAVVAWAQNAWITITSAEERKNKPHYLINGEVPLVNEYLSSFSPFSPLYCICCKTIMFPNNVLNSYICFLNKILKVFKENSHSSSLLSWILSTTFSNLTTSITLSFAIQLQTAVPNTNWTMLHPSQLLNPASKRHNGSSDGFEFSRFIFVLPLAWMSWNKCQ